MPSLTPLWNPHQVLQIQDDDRCVGYAPSRGRKCRNIIAGYNLSKADTLLNSIAQEEPDADALRSKLRRLAEYLLCARWHQPQARDMVDKWVERVKSAYPYGEVVEPSRIRTSASSRRNISPSSSASSSASVSSRRTTSSASSVSLPTHSERESLEEIIANLQELLRTQGLLAEPNHPSSRNSTTISRIPTSDNSSLDRSRSSAFLPSTSTRLQARTSTSSSSARPTPPQSQTSSSPSSTRATPPQAQTSTTPSSARVTRPQAQTSTPASSVSATRPQAQTSTPSSDRSADIVIASSTSLTRSHIRQRAFDDECPICMEEFLSDDLIMWCKSGCGWNVHQNCFEKWETQCVASERSTTCILCREAWENQSAVKVRESCTRTHVRRLDIDDECPICQEDYRPDDSLVWCKDGCGRTVHRDCFREWQTHLDNGETSATCAFCRNVWASDCGCDR